MTARTDNPARIGGDRAPLGLVGAAAALAASPCCRCGSAPAAAWWNDEWTLRKKITIDTSAVRRQYHRSDRHDAGAGAPARRQFPLRLGQGGRRRPALRRRRRQDAAQASRREIRLAARRGAGVGRRAECASRARRPTSGSITATESRRRRRRQGHLRSATRCSSIISPSAARRRTIRRRGPTARRASARRRWRDHRQRRCGSTARRR